MKRETISGGRILSSKRLSYKIKRVWDKSMSDCTYELYIDKESPISYKTISEVYDHLKELGTFID